ncbi:MAG: protein kinase [Myxococcales bacterium]|nr:protein kinase [Myxococcales bacterium]
MSDRDRTGEALTACAACGEALVGSKPHVCINDRATVPKNAASGQSDVATAKDPPSGGMQEGQVIGDKYQILGRLSEGGMGTVYRARHMTLGTQLAIKLVKSDGDSQFERRFTQEALLASSVQHPNIIYLLDFGSLPDGRSYLVMEFLQGRTLTDAIRQGPMDVARACVIALQLVRGIAAVHAKGIVHRDLKPDNVFLIEQDGVSDMVKIIDFGIAKRAKAAGQEGTPPPLPDPSYLATSPGAKSADAPVDIETLTRVGALLGTPGYMAPEQIRGMRVDARTDQYAIGCILYKMLTGRPPYESKSAAELMAMHLMDQPRPVQELRGQNDMPPGLAAIVMRLLAKKPDERFPNLSVVEEGLLAELNQLGERASRVTGRIPGLRVSGSNATTGAIAAPLPEPAPPWFRTRRVQLAAAGMAVLMLALVGLLIRRWSSDKAPTVADLLQFRQRAIEQLSQDLRDGDAEVRLLALSALGTSHDAIALPILSVIAQGSGSDRERSTALLAIGELGDRAGVAVLASQLAHAQVPLLAEAAAQALLAMGDSRGTDYFVQRFQGKAGETALRSAVRLCEHGHVAAANKLAALLSEKRLPEHVELDALTCLARAGSVRAIDQLRSALAGGPDVLLLPSASALRVLHSAERLAKLGHADGVDFLLHVAQGSGPLKLQAARLLASPLDRRMLSLLRASLASPALSLDERSVVIAGLADSGDSSDLSALWPWARATQPYTVRIAAASAILQISSLAPNLRTQSDLQHARTGLRDSNWLVRHSAVPLLERNDEAEALSLLGQALQDEKGQVRARAMQVISRSGSKEALRLIETALRSEPQDVRQAALSAVMQVARTAYRHGGSNAAMVRKWLLKLSKSDNAAQQAAAHAGRLLLGEPERWHDLRTQRSSPDPLLRVLVAQSAVDDRDVLGALLADEASAVRLAAALRLAALKDRRGLSVLRSALDHGGATSIHAEAALRSLGETPGGKDSLQRLHDSESIEERMALVETANSLPSVEALALLSEAAHDIEPYVRRLVAEIVAEASVVGDLGPKLAILAHLSSDPSPMVRTRATALLSQLLHHLPSVDKPHHKPAVAAISRAFRPSEAPSPPPTPATVEPALPGELSVSASNPTLFRIDGQSWQRTPVRPFKLVAGPHRLRSLSAQHTVEIPAGGALQFELPESAIEQGVRAARESLAKGDGRRSVKLLEKARVSCPQSGDLASPCRVIHSEAAYLLGSVYEAEERWGDAVAQYQQATKQSGEVIGRIDFSVEAEAALKRLLPRVGRVLVPQQKGRKCVEVTIWMTAGKHEVVVGGKKTEVTVRPGTTVLAGECPGDE